jgi:hypothetical protein
MAEVDPTSRPDPRPLFSWPRFQFSLGKLLLAITVVAIVLFLATHVASFIEMVFFTVTACIIPTPFVIGAIYGRSDVKSFSIGALIPWFAAITVHYPGPLAAILELIWLVATGAICGAVAVMTRRWIFRNPME